jgi:hypothetical protein
LINKTQSRWKISNSYETYLRQVVLGLCACLLLLSHCFAADAPKVVSKDGRFALMVDGRPYLIFGDEPWKAHAQNFDLVAPMSREIAQLEFDGKLKTAAEEPGQTSQEVDFEPWQAIVAFGFPQPDRRRAPGTKDASPQQRDERNLGPIRVSLGLLGSERGCQYPLVLYKIPFTNTISSPRRNRCTRFSVVDFIEMLPQRNLVTNFVTTVPKIAYSCTKTFGSSSCVR